jgi:flagellar protein FliJ
MAQRAQAAADRLTHARDELAQQEARLQQLCDYRADYHQKFHTTLAHGAAIARMTDFQLFLQRLDVAIEQQRQRVKLAEDEAEKCRLEWLQHRIKAKAVDTVVDRYKKKEQAQADRREQKEFDEIAQRTSRRSNDHPDDEA